MHIRLTSACLLVAVFLVGVAYISILPPFEAFDETAYWSAIQQLSDSGQIPHYGKSRMSRDVDTYPGPMAAPEGQPYLDYFQRGSPSRAAGQTVVTTGPSKYMPARDFNYEAQHPPLFYLLMAWPYRAAATLTWPWHMFALRLVAWTVAFAGFAWGAQSTQAVLRRRGATGALLFVPMAWPFLFPQFFPEFTRITNDTLCLFLMAPVWCLLLGWLERGATWGRALALGVVLGLGLLTKAFFLPVSAGVCALLLLVAARRRGPAEWPTALSACALAALIGGPWYVGNLLTTGVLTGAGDTIGLAAHGGLLAGLRAHFSPVLYGLGLARMVAGFCWAGTWSFAHPSRVSVIPLAALILLPLTRYCASLRRQDFVAVAPVFIVAPVLAGLLYHLLGMVAAARQDGGTPGWFLHIFAGPLALALALGWARRWLMLPLVIYAGLFSVIVLWMQAAFFSGCLPRVGRGLVSLSAATCVVDVSRLRLLALPDMAIVSFVPAFAALGAAGVIVAKRSRDPVT